MPRRGHSQLAAAEDARCGYYKRQLYGSIACREECSSLQAMKPYGWRQKSRSTTMRTAIVLHYGLITVPGAGEPREEGGRGKGRSPEGSEDRRQQ
jgi:hypothetical protein